LNKHSTGKRRRTKPDRTNVYIEKAKGLQAAGVPAVRLLDKPTVMAIAGASFVSIWTWMRAGTFPRSRIVHGRSMWLSTEIEEWLRQLPRRRLKGDPQCDIEASTDSKQTKRHKTAKNAQPHDGDDNDGRAS
jgi:predicted DNA-binding transcriptional regulator AlpA